MKKLIINLVLILVGILIYFLQANFFTGFSIAGIKPNLFIVYILFISLFTNKVMSISYSLFWGTFLDVIYNEKIAIYLGAFLCISFISILFEKNFSKDSRMTIMFMVFGLTIIYEVIVLIFRYVLYSINLDILSFIKILTIEIVYNILITIIIYPMFQSFGYSLENEYKGNKIITRYF